MISEESVRKIVREELLDLIKHSGEVRGEIGKIILEVIGKTLSKIRDDVEELKKDVKEIKAELKRHSELLEEHSRDIAEIKAELKRHSELLEEHSRDIAEIKAELKRHSELLEEHSRELKRHSELLEEHSRELKRLSQLAEEQMKLLKKIASYLETTIGIGVEEDIRVIAKAVLENLGYEVKRHRTKSGYDVDILIKDSVVKMIEVKRTVRDDDLRKVRKVRQEIREEFSEKEVLKPLVIAYQRALSEKAIKDALSLGISIITVEDIRRTPRLNKKARLLEERLKRELNERLGIKSS